MSEEINPWKALRFACDGLERICMGTADEADSSSIAEKALFAAIGHMGVSDIAVHELAARGGEDAPGSEPKPVTRYALVELMGHAQVTGSWRETTLCGRPMLEVTRLDVAERRVQLVGPESVYRLTPLTEAEAMHVTRYARAALTSAGQRAAYDEDAEADELDDVDPFTLGGDPIGDDL